MGQASGSPSVCGIVSGHSAGGCSATACGMGLACGDVLCLAFFVCDCLGVGGSSASANRERDCASCKAASVVRLREAMVLTRFLRALWSSTGAGVHGFTLEMSRGGGCDLHGGRLRAAPLENLGLSVESRAILVMALPFSS